ncbi:MAG: hypothetical protein AABY22_14605 [Nanoarchaeota archaeon]
MDKEFQEIKESLAKEHEKFKKILAEMENKEDMVHRNEMYETMDRMYSYMMRQIDYVSNAFWDYRVNHNKGHLPPIKTSSGMQAALEALGMGDDFEVEKPTISIANTKRGVQIIASFKPSK